MCTRPQDLLFESLEPRRLLAASIEDGELLVVGTQGDNQIVIEAGDAPGQVTLFGVYDVADGTTFEGVDAVRVHLLRGDDSAEVVGPLRDTSGAMMGVTMFGGLGNDTLLGSNGDDLLVGGPGNDVIGGREGDDLVFGRSGADWIFGGPGNDVMTGNWGPDRVFGGAGNDLLYGGKGHDHVYGGTGADVIAGQLGFDFVMGGDGDDVVRGGGHADVLRGGIGNDALFGGWGPDDLYGGMGADELVGAGGPDRFRGHMGERQDFSDGDDFYNENVSDLSVATLSDEFWTDVDQIDAQSELSEEVWTLIDGAETILSECGPYIEQSAIAIESLTEQELAQIAEDLQPVLELFFAEASTWDGESTDVIFQLFDQIIAAFPSSVQQPMTSLVTCMQDHEALFAEMNAAMETLQQQGEVPDVWSEVWGAYGSALGA